MSDRVGERAWILPRGQESVLWRRADETPYRAGVALLVEVGPVPMPACAVHWLDLEADMLVYAHERTLIVFRGLLRGGRATSTVKLPWGSTLHALTVIDDVVYVGANAGRGMLGWVDLRAPLRFCPIEVPAEARALGKGVDGFAAYGGRLVAIDDFVSPRYLLVLDVADPRAPRLVDTRTLPPHGSRERIVSVSARGDTAAMLSTSANRGMSSVHVAFLDLPTLEEWVALHVQGDPSIRRRAARSYDFRAIALHGDRLLIAAGADGIGLLPIPPRPPDLASRPRSPGRPIADGPSIAEEELRFVPVPASPVIDVIPVDEATAFAVVEVSAGGLFKGRRFEAALVALTA